MIEPKHTHPFTHKFHTVEHPDCVECVEPSPEPEVTLECNTRIETAQQFTASLNAWSAASEVQAPAVPRYQINCEGELEESRFGIVVMASDHLAEIASLREKLALAECKGWNEAIEACERIVDESDGYSERISALRKGEK